MLQLTVPQKKMLEHLAGLPGGSDTPQRGYVTYVYLVSQDRNAVERMCTFLRDNGLITIQKDDDLPCFTITDQGRKALREGSVPTPSASSPTAKSTQQSSRRVAPFAPRVPPPAPPRPSMPPLAPVRSPVSKGKGQPIPSTELWRGIRITAVNKEVLEALADFPGGKVLAPRSGLVLSKALGITEPALVQRVYKLVERELVSANMPLSQQPESSIALTDLGKEYIAHFGKEVASGAAAKPPPEEPRDDAGTSAERQTRSFSVTKAERRVIAQLVKLPDCVFRHPGGANNALAKKFDMTPQNLSMHLYALEMRGIVFRERATTSNSVVAIGLTAEAIDWLRQNDPELALDMTFSQASTVVEENQPDGNVASSQTGEGEAQAAEEVEATPSRAEVEQTADEHDVEDDGTPATRFAEFKHQILTDVLEPFRDLMLPMLTVLDQQAVALDHQQDDLIVSQAEVVRLERANAKLEEELTSARAEIARLRAARSALIEQILHDKDIVD